MNLVKDFDWSGMSKANQDILMPAVRRLRFPSGRIRQASGHRVRLLVTDLAAQFVDPPHGLYRKPTTANKAGIVEIVLHTMVNADEAREVLDTEIAHAVDFAVMTRRQRAAIYALFHDTADHPAHGPLPTELGPDDWFNVEGTYYTWPGEAWMGLFLSTYAPGMPQPLAATQPWTHKHDKIDARCVRRIMMFPELYWRPRCAPRVG